MTKWSRWTTERIEEAAKLWSTGMSGKTVAMRMGVSWGAMSSIASSHRDLFPMRLRTKFTLPTDYRQEVVAPKLDVPTRRTFIAGQWIEHVKRTTQSGAVVTMPRVSFIDGVREDI